MVVPCGSGSVVEWLCGGGRSSGGPADAGRLGEWRLGMCDRLLDQGSGRAQHHITDPMHGGVREVWVCGGTLCTCAPGRGMQGEMQGAGAGASRVWAHSRRQAGRQQQQRVTLAWTAVSQLEQTCRHDWRLGR